MCSCLINAGSMAEFQMVTRRSWPGVEARMDQVNWRELLPGMEGHFRHILEQVEQSQQPAQSKEQGPLGPDDSPGRPRFQIAPFHNLTFYDGASGAFRGAKRIDSVWEGLPCRSKQPASLCGGSRTLASNAWFSAMYSDPARRVMREHLGSPCFSAHRRPVSGAPHWRLFRVSAGQRLTRWRRSSTASRSLPVQRRRRCERDRFAQRQTPVSLSHRLAEK